MAGAGPTQGEPVRLCRSLVVAVQIVRIVGPIVILAVIARLAHSAQHGPAERTKEGDACASPEMPPPTETPIAEAIPSPTVSSATPPSL